MGIGGSGMKGVAKLASQMGYQVTGCDLNDGDHSQKHLKNIDLLIISPAVLYQNKVEPEFLQAKKKDIVMTWQEFLGKILLKNKKVIAIAGTHGKSTTTAMASKLLIDNGFDPICVLGAFVPEWGGNARFGKGEYAVIEADEFNDNFLHYHPEIAIITNIEFDHPDYFKDGNEVRKSFKKFANQSKTVIAKAKLKKFNLKVFGEHNQQNASFVYELGQKLGVSDEEIVKSIESFTGIGRRMELIGKTKSGTLIYDDYAHHPTAIKVTLEGLRDKYPNKKILAVIEPHGYKRTKALLPLYKNAFDSVDGVIIGPIFKARDKKDKSVSLSQIAKISNHKNTEVFEDIGKLIKNCKLKIVNYNYEVIVVMGAGNSNLWAQKLLVN